MGLFSCLVNLLPEPVDTLYDLKFGTGLITARRQFLMPTYCFRMICASSSISLFIVSVFCCAPTSTKLRGGGTAAGPMALASCGPKPFFR